ncbi:FUSC family protein [Brucella neotomae]|uniref:Fusaric acid resistance protein n=1 Tax=Brucella neotomae 5K33 TaxID=520456 RepID=A0A7U8PVI3_BRUNE|nr:FUSC family protein [Brucella neotomae]EEY02486.1 fusaric acid resistance protein [Brucella neotomae 5K33]KEX99815.1 fusaric acid resistance protein [Brucella neotomae 5K33]KFJ58159.1 aluminum activated malate transporter family protein [Brucella neotomae 5K33]SPU70096.1 fusaric acid resistance protein [Brucella neotomae]SPU71356.1 fusaric acid resistance protein [Brucella neotomae]
MTKLAETTPKFWDVVFSLKTFAAAMFALWIGLMANLPNPYWSVAAVYIVAHPLSGATTSKGFYRLIGTIIGGAVTVVFVPHLVNSPEILTLAIGLWMGLCLVISLLDGTPRSYLFMLAGYTVAIASFAVVQAPETTFDYALGRVEEIAVGIICAAVVNRLVFPRHSGPVLVGRIDNWLRDGSKLAVASMRGEGDSPEFRRDRQRLAADTLELRNLTTHVAYDTSSIRNVAPLLHVLQQRMVAVLPIISSLHDVLLLKPGEGEKPWHPAVQQLLDEVCDWLQSGENLTEERRAVFLRLIEEIDRHSRDASTWGELLPFNLSARIRDLVQIWSDCLTLKQDISSGSRHSLRWRRYDAHLKGRPMHRDYGMALLSGFSSFLATCVATALWVASGWAQGSAAAMMAGIFCCIFATMDDPVPVIRKFNWLLMVVIAAAFVFEFALLPLVNGFMPLVLVLGLFLVPAGMLLVIPSQFLLGMVLCVNLPNMLMLQSHLTLDFPSFANANLATVLGIVIAAVVTSIVRSVGAEWSVRRLVKAGWSDIVLATERRPGRYRREHMNRLLLRMIDRIGMMAPRLALIPDADVAKVDLLRDLRNGMNTIDLQQYRAKLPAPCREAVDEVLDGVGAHYRALSNKTRDTVEHIDERLLAAIDKAIATIIENGSPAVARRPRIALVALRFNLFPKAPPFVLPPLPQLEFAQAA